MAVTVSVTSSWAAGARHARAVNVTFDSSYDTGGEAVTLSQLQLRRAVSHISAGVIRNSSGDAYWVSWDGSHTAPKLIVSRTDQVDDPGEQAPGAVDLSGFSGRFLVFGR